MIDFVLNHYDEAITLVAATLTIASIIAGWTKTPDDDAVIRRIIDFLSFLKPRDAAGTLKLPLTSTKKE